jgi:hypothetical protein
VSMPSQKNPGCQEIHLAFGCLSSEVLKHLNDISQLYSHPHSAGSIFVCHGTSLFPSISFQAQKILDSFLTGIGASCL